MQVALYVLRCADNSFYVGITKNLARRLSEHSYGARGKWFVQKRLHPFMLIYSQLFDSWSDAMKREKYYKKLNRKRLLSELKIGEA